MPSHTGHDVDCRKSSRSKSSGDCAEVARAPRQLADDQNEPR